MADSFENVRRRASEAAGSGKSDQSKAMRKLDPRQRKALEWFQASNSITSRDLEGLFRISQRASRNLLSAWVVNGFVKVADPAKKTRKYALSAEFAVLLQ